MPTMAKARLELSHLYCYSSVLKLYNQTISYIRRPDACFRIFQANDVFGIAVKQTIAVLFI